jgi:arabinose-5-phosphate isomerase
LRSKPLVLHDDRALTELGRRVLQLEAAAVSAVAGRLDQDFARAVRLLADAGGRVIVSGVGKSGLIARKLAATLTSTGTAASYLHPVDSLHGDLGIVGPSDVAIVLSKSGESQDLFGLVGSLQRLGVPIIAITGATDSALSRVATVTLDGSVTEEACPHDLAPTASTTVALALGDALAVALLEVKGFRREDFAALHPGGSLGRRLLLRVRDVMLPPGRILRPDATMRDAVVSLAHDRGLAMVSEDGHLAGVLTTGDLTRMAERDPKFLERQVSDVMTRTAKTASPTDLAGAAVGAMQRHGIIVLPVVDPDGAIVGVVHLHDLMRAGAV